MSLNPPNAKQIFATCGLSRQTSQRAIHYWFGINSDWLSFRPEICGALTKRNEIASDLFVLSRRNRGGSKNLFELTRVTDLEQTIAIATRHQSYNIEISLSTGVICLDLIWSSGWVMSWKGLGRWLTSERRCGSHLWSNSYSPSQDWHRFQSTFHIWEYRSRHCTVD